MEERRAHVSHHKSFFLGIFGLSHRKESIKVLRLGPLRRPYDESLSYCTDLPMTRIQFLYQAHLLDAIINSAKHSDPQASNSNSDT